MLEPAFRVRVAGAPLGISSVGRMRKGLLAAHHQGSSQNIALLGMEFFRRLKRYEVADGEMKLYK